MLALACSNIIVYLVVFVEVVILTKRKSVETRTDLISKKNIDIDPAGSSWTNDDSLSVSNPPS